MWRFCAGWLVAAANMQLDDDGDDDDDDILFRFVKMHVMQLG